LADERWEAMRHLLLLAMLAAVGGCAGLAGSSGWHWPTGRPLPAPAAPSPEPEATVPNGMGPIVRGTDDATAPAEGAHPPPAPAARTSAPIKVDEKTRTVHIPVRLTGARGVVEWLLAAGDRHKASAVLVTDRSAGEVAAAMARVGLAPGVRPEPVGEDRATIPQGSALAVTVIIKDAAGRPMRIPAERLLSRQSGGEPLAEGRWVYAGPQVVLEADAEINVTELSGSLATTNLRDASALIYWVPAPDDRRTGDEAAPFVLTYYPSNLLLPEKTESCDLEIRAAGGP
jgi:hypothetical protein